MIEVFESTTSASINITGDWHSINWKPCYGNVKKLQARIVKATKSGRWNKVKSLQRLLTHSFSGKESDRKPREENSWS